MGRKIAKKVRGMNWKTRISLILIFTMVFSTFMYQGFYRPIEAQATIANVSAGSSGRVNGWAHPSTGTGGPYTITDAQFSCGTGPNRMIVAIITSEVGTAAAQNVTITKGAGNTFTQRITSGSLRRVAGIYTLPEANINGNTNSITVTFGGTLPTGSDVMLACLSGVDQAQPIVTGGTYGAGSATAAATTTYNVAAEKGGYVVFGLATGTGAPGLAALTGYTESYDAAGTGYGYALDSKLITTTGTETASPTWSSQTWGIAVASLKPAAPTVVSTSPNNMDKNTGPTTVTITGTNFESGATVSFSGDGITLGSPTFVNSTTITVPVTVAITATSGARNVTVTNTATDGLAGTGTGVFTVNVPSDVTPPTVSSVTVQTGLTIDLAFSEIMGTGATTASNYTLSGAGKGTLANNPNSVALISGSTYRLTWLGGEMMNSGDITVTVANAQDFWGNTIGSPNSATHAGGGIGSSPSVTINQAGGQPDPTGASPINFTVVFSEPTTTFATGDVTITGSAGGTKTATVTGSGTTYNVAVTGMTTGGTVIATLLPGVATDAAGNPNLPSTSTDNSVNFSNSYPILSVAEPNGIGDSLMVGNIFNITYTLTDSDDIVTAAFYYDTNSTGLDGTAITGACATAPEGTNTFCAWNTTGVTPGTYFVYGITSDGRGNISAYSVGAVTVLPTCVPAAPMAEIMDLPKFITTDNGNVVYSVKITNMDFGGNCTDPLTIDLSRADTNSPKFSSSIPASVSLAPGASTTVNLTVTEATAATDDTTTTTVTASAAAHGSGIATVVTTYHPNNPLVHNSISTDSTKWTSFGGWGIENRKYGKFDCDTCHVRLATNIKSIKSSVTTPDNSRGTLPGDGQTILFDRTSWTTLGVSGTMGDDSNTPRASSSRICEVCHTYDATAANGNKVHAYNTGTDNLGNHMNANATDCTVCHKHSVGFKTVSCETCHGMPPIGGASLATYQGTTTGSAFAGKHATHVTTLGFDCDSCHKDFVMPEPSATANPGFWDISIKFSNFGATTGTYSGQLGLSYNQSAGAGGLNCSTVYCHSGKNGTLDGINMSPAWNAAVVCGDCHKATAANPPSLGSHPRHTGQGAGQLRLLCSDCHGVNGAGGQGHLDGKIQWDLNNSLAKIGANAKYSGSNSGMMANLAPSSSYQNCSSLYCHSNVQGANGVGDPTDFKTPQWGGGTIGCGGCHVDNSGVSGTGSHVKHSNVYSFACSVCHNAAGSGTLEHADYTIDLNFSGQAAGTYYSQSGVPGNGYGTCAVSYCHSNVQAPGGNAPATLYGTPEWGNASQLSCGFCHNDMSATNDLTLGTHQRHTNAAGIATYSCSMCHGNGYTWNTVNRTVHANGNIDTSFTGKAAGTTYSQAGTNTPGSGGYGTCSTNSCHGRATKNWGVSSALPVCEKCHGSVASIVVDGDFRDTAGAVGSAYSGTHKSHLTAVHGYTEAIACDTCHSVPTEFGDIITGIGHTGSLPATLTWSNLAKGAIADPGNPSHSGVSYSGAPGRTCSTTYCHSRGGAKPTPSWGDLGYGLSCGNCHGYPPALPHPQGAEAANCKGCHYHVASSNTGFEANYRLLSGLCSNRTYSSDAVTCATNGGTWTPAGTVVPGNSLHVDGIVLVDEDRCLNCHSTEGDFALIGQHSMHTDNDYFLSTSRDTGTATGGSQTSVVDTGKSWTSGSYAGYYVRVTVEGLDHGRQLEIDSNTPNTLTLKSGKWFSSAVANGTTYNIREGKKLSNDDYDDPSWIYSIMYDSGFPRYACGTCHPDNSALHRNGVVNLDMDPTHSLPGTVKTKNWTTNQYAQTTSLSDVTCMNVYCHSSGYISPATQKYQYMPAPNWYAAAPWASVDRCAQCHGNSPNTAGSVGSPAHAKHARGIHNDDTFTGTTGNMLITASHGDGNSTIVNCNVCHNDTVKVAYNDKNTICATCHGSSAPMKGTATVDPLNTTHINGTPDVIFAAPLNLKTKAQLRNDLAWVTVLDQSWSRQNGYKWSSLSHDLTRINPTYSAGTCSSTSCHNNTPMQWNQAGPLQCMVCHTGLPN